MTEEVKKGFFQSKAFILICVWIGLGVVLTIIMYSAMPKMQDACRAWEKELPATSGHGADHGSSEAATGEGHGHEAETPGHGTAPGTESAEHREHGGPAGHGEGGGHHDPCHTVSLANAGFHSNLAAVFHGMYGTDGKMRLATAWSIPNFLILITILWWAASGPLNDMFKNNREDLKKAMDEAQRAREEAEARLAEYKEKLEKVNDEIARVRREVKAEAEQEKARLVAEAEKIAERIKNEADFTAKQEVLMARHRLREEAARLAVELAENVIRETINDGDRDRLLDEYLGKIQEQRK